MPLRRLRPDRSGRKKRGWCGMADGRGRREPVFDVRGDASTLDLRLSREDRAGGDMPKAKRRARPGDDRNAGAPEPRRPKTRKRRRSLTGRLVYGMLVLGLWGFDRARAASSPITPRNCRRSTSSPCRSGRPTSPFWRATARCSPIAARPAGARSRSRNCRPICPRRSSPSRTAASTIISASIRSASRAPSCAT